MPDLDLDGAALSTAALTPRQMADLTELGQEADPARPGRRMVGDARVGRLTRPGSTLFDIAAQVIGGGCRPVRAVLFDKSADNNWPLGWHQDRTIAVAGRADVPGYGPFTAKAGLTHVQPPPELLNGMVTLRAHLDPCGTDNAPLKVALGSHLLGLIPTAEVAGVVASHRVVANLAEPGDVWCYRTLILHASDAARVPKRRRVLQVDFAAVDLPHPLKWLGV